MHSYRSRQSPVPPSSSRARSVFVLSGGLVQAGIRYVYSIQFATSSISPCSIRYIRCISRHPLSDSMEQADKPTVYCSKQHIQHSKLSTRYTEYDPP